MKAGETIEVEFSYTMPGGLCPARPLKGAQ